MSNHQSHPNVVALLCSDEQDKSKKKTKAEKQKEQEAECDYERRPRSFHGDDKEYKVLLPIKGQDGVIPRLVEIERQEEGKSCCITYISLLSHCT